MLEVEDLLVEIDESDPQMVKRIEDFTNFIEKKCLQRLSKNLLFRLINVGKKLQQGYDKLQTNWHQSNLRVFQSVADPSFARYHL